MHLSSLITGFTVLSAGALAMPAPANETVLVKRGMGSIGAFKNRQCTGPALGERPDDDRGCIAFTPETHFVGINWGNDAFRGRAANLHVYKRPDCSGFYHEIKASAVNNKEGTNACVLDTKYGGGGWNSVRFHGLIN